jgi:hypothetical protein
MCRALFEANFLCIIFKKTSYSFPTQSSSEAVYLSCLKYDFTIKIDYRIITGTLPSKRKMSMTSADVEKCFKIFANLTT